MIETLYIEEEALQHPRAQAIAARFPKATRVVIDRYGEVFNRRAQNFRLQKRAPALILAIKHGSFVLPTPPGYGIGSPDNHYFSHMLNCPYDCRYCFLQGMYPSAHHVVFVNYEDFAAAIAARVAERAAVPRDSEAPCFFSGYDCDSLAFDSITGFAGFFLPVFARHPHAWFELRTKSLNVGALLEREPLPNVVVAFSLTPPGVAARLEHGAPPVERRVAVIRRLAAAGWPIGLRFDPLIHAGDIEAQYVELFRQVFAALPVTAIHSVSLGPLRFPKAMYDRIVKLYPEERLLASLVTRDDMVSYATHLEVELRDTVGAALARHVPEKQIFGIDCPVVS